MEYSNWVRVRISREPYLPSTEDADVDNIKKKNTVLHVFDWY